LLVIPEPETIPKDPRTVFNSHPWCFPGKSLGEINLRGVEAGLKRQGTPSLRWGQMSHNVVAELLLSD
jgi:hypothetical protein